MAADETIYSVFDSDNDDNDGVVGDIDNDIPDATPVGIQDIKSKLPKTVEQFKNMIDDNWDTQQNKFIDNNKNITSDKFIQISTYISLQITKEMKENDDENQEEYIRQKKKLINKGNKYDQNAQMELQKIDKLNIEKKKIINILNHKREELNNFMKNMYKKHTEFLQEEKRKAKIFQQLEIDKQRLEQLEDKIDAELYKFENELSVISKTVNLHLYNKIESKIKIVKLKQSVLTSKIESIDKTIELTDLKSLDLNECQCVFCKGYSPQQFYFISKGLKKKQKRKQVYKINNNNSDNKSKTKFNSSIITHDDDGDFQLNIDNISLSDDDNDDNDDDDDDGVIEIVDVNNNNNNDYVHNTKSFGRPLSIITEHSSEEKHDELYLNSDNDRISNKKPKSAALKIKNNKKRKRNSDKQNIIHSATIHSKPSLTKRYSENDLTDNLMDKMKRKQQLKKYNSGNINSNTKTDPKRNVISDQDAVDDLMKKLMKKNKKRLKSPRISSMSSSDLNNKNRKKAVKISRISRIDDDIERKKKLKKLHKRRSSTAMIPVDNTRERYKDIKKRKKRHSSATIGDIGGLKNRKKPLNLAEMIENNDKHKKSKKRIKSSGRIRHHVVTDINDLYNDNTIDNRDDEKEIKVSASGKKIKQKRYKSSSNIGLSASKPIRNVDHKKKLKKKKQKRVTPSMDNF